MSPVPLPQCSVLGFFSKAVIASREHQRHPGVWRPLVCSALAGPQLHWGAFWVNACQMFTCFNFPDSQQRPTKEKDGGSVCGAERGGVERMCVSVDVFTCLWELARVYVSALHGFVCVSWAVCVCVCVCLYQLSADGWQSGSCSQMIQYANELLSVVLQEQYTVFLTVGIQPAGNRLHCTHG